MPISGFWMTTTGPNRMQAPFSALSVRACAESGLLFGQEPQRLLPAWEDAYIRILDDDDRTELVSFRMTDYYTNVISMMISFSNL